MEAIYAPEQHFLSYQRSTCCSLCSYKLFLNLVTVYFTATVLLGREELVHNLHPKE